MGSSFSQERRLSVSVTFSFEGTILPSVTFSFDLTRPQTDYFNAMDSIAPPAVSLAAEEPAHHIRCRSVHLADSYVRRARVATFLVEQCFALPVPERDHQQADQEPGDQETPAQEESV